MKSASRGSVRLHSSDPRVPLSIDHGFLSDPDDSTVLTECVESLRRLAAGDAVRASADRETRPRPEVNAMTRCAGTARGFSNPVATCAIGRLRVQPGGDDGGLDLARAGRGGGVDRRVHDLAAAVGEDRPAARGRGSPSARTSPCRPGRSPARDLLDAEDVVRVVRLGDERAERGDVDLDPLVVLAAVVGTEVARVVLAPLPAQPVARPLVGREHWGGRAEFGDQVRDRAALGQDSVAVPGPVDSNTLPLPPRTVSCRRRSRTGARPSPPRRRARRHRSTASPAPRRWSCANRRRSARRRAGRSARGGCSG